jgi:FtsZ-binding cell division protein ZapB
VERSRQKSDMLQGYGDTVLHAETLERELDMARKHSALLQSKLDEAFAQYHNEVQEMQAKSDDLARMNKSLRQKNKGMSSAKLLSSYLGTLLWSDIALSCLQSWRP